MAGFYKDSEYLRPSFFWKNAVPSGNLSFFRCVEVRRSIRENASAALGGATIDL